MARGSTRLNAGQHGSLMDERNVQYPPDTTDYHRAIVVLGGDQADDFVQPIASAPAGTERALPVRNIPSGTQNVSVTSSSLPSGAATEATLQQIRDQESDFKRLLKFEPVSGEELRADDLSTDRYHGAAPDGTAESATSWKVVRFYKDAGGNIIRVRYRTGVRWDQRTSGW